MGTLLDKTTFGDTANETFEKTEAESSAVVRMGRRNAESGPVIHSRMIEDAGAIQDVSGNELHLQKSVAGLTAVPDGGVRGGDALDFDPTASGWLNVANQALFDDWLEFTMEAWVRGDQSEVPGNADAFFFMRSATDDVILMGHGMGINPDNSAWAGAAILCGDDGGGGLDCVTGDLSLPDTDPADLQHVSIRFKRAIGEEPARMVLETNGTNREFDFEGVMTLAIPASGTVKFTPKPAASGLVNIPAGTIVERTSDNFQYQTVSSVNLLATAIKAAGIATFTKAGGVTGWVRIPAGTVVETAGVVQFVTDNETFFDSDASSTVDVPITAVVGGAAGNVGIATITTIPTPVPAQKAIGVVTFTKTGPATGQITIPAGTLVETGGAVQFETDAEVVLDADVGSTVDANITAVVAGTAGTVGSGTITVITVPITGIASVTNTDATRGGQAAGAVNAVTNAAPTTGGQDADTDVSVTAEAVLAGASGNTTIGNVTVIPGALDEFLTVTNTTDMTGGADDVLWTDGLGNPRAFDGQQFPAQVLEIGKWTNAAKFAELRLAGFRLFDKWIEDSQLDWFFNAAYTHIEDFGGAVLGTHINVVSQVNANQDINLIVETSDDNFLSVNGRQVVVLRTGDIDYHVGLDGRYWRFRYEFSSRDPRLTPLLNSFRLEGYDIKSTTAIRGMKSNLPHNYGLRESDILNQFYARWAVELGLSIEQADLAIDMIFLHLAGGVWLDRHGEWYDVPRRSPEEDTDDDAYQERIITETIRPRANNKALEDILQQNGFSVQIIDLWDRIDILGGSTSVSGESLDGTPGGGRFIGADPGGTLLNRHPQPGTYKATSNTSKVITDGLVEDEALSHLGAAEFEGTDSGAVTEIPVRVEELTITFSPSTNTATVGIDGIITGQVDPAGTNTFNFTNGQINVTSIAGGDTGAIITYTRVPDGTLRGDIGAGTNIIQKDNGLADQTFSDGAASSSATCDYLDGGQDVRKGLFGVILSVQKVYSEIPLEDRIRIYELLEKHKTAGTYMVFLAPSAFLISTDLLADPGNRSVVNEDLSGQRFPVGPIGGLFTIVSVIDFIGFGLKYTSIPYETEDVDVHARWRFSGNLNEDEGKFLSGKLNRGAFTGEAVTHSAGGQFIDTLLNVPVDPDSITVTMSGGAGPDNIATDDGAGAMIGDVAADTNTVDYNDGDIAVQSDDSNDDTATADYDGGEKGAFTPSPFDQRLDHSAPALGDTELVTAADAYTPLAAFTIDMLVHPIQFASPETQESYILRKRADGANFEWELSYRGDGSGNLIFQIKWFDGGTKTLDSAAIMSPDMAQQYWLRVVFDSAATDKVKFFVDGVLEDDDTNALSGGDDKISVEGYSTTERFLGALEDLTISHVARA